MSLNDNTSSVFVSIIGKPNVGKSSLMNRLVGEKVAIVTPKPQTTRTRITGILTENNVQYVFYDTPGVHRPRTKLGQRMLKAASGSIGDGDVTTMVFEPFSGFTDEERQCMVSIKKNRTYSVAIINKIDTVDKEKLAVRTKELDLQACFDEIIYTSAQEGTGCKELLKLLAGKAVVGPFYFDPEEYTDQPEKVLVAEIVREKLLTYLQQEIPHGVAVDIERFKEREDKPIIDIGVVIICEKKSHKGMVIGKGGLMLKKIGTAARLDCEEILGSKVNMEFWVKVREDWRDDERALTSFGFQK